MKIREGFVSNSSSTSFSIYGAIVEKEAEEKTFLDYFYGDPNAYDRSTYIGLEYSSMSDDETKKQFKEKIEVEVKRLYGDTIQCGSYEESYYDS